MRKSGGPRCPRCAAPMNFTVQIPNVGRQQAYLLFYRCDSCKRMIKTRPRNATQLESKQVASQTFNR